MNTDLFLYTIPTVIVVRCRAQVWLRWRQDVRPGALRDGAGVLGPLGGACEARRAVPLRARLAGLQSETLELSDSADMDRRDATARLLRLQRRQHAQPLLRVQQPPTYLLAYLITPLQYGSGVL